MAKVSADLQWLCIRKTSSFLRRQRGIPKHFSTEKFNLSGWNSIRHNGLVQKRGIDVQLTNYRKLMLRTKIMKKRRKPGSSYNKIIFFTDSRRTLRRVGNISRRYRRSHTKLAMQRASQLLRSLRPLSVRKGKRGRKADVKVSS